jgi:ERCC4-type nuclease
MSNGDLDTIKRSALKIYETDIKPLLKNVAQLQPLIMTLDCREAELIKLLKDIPFVTSSQLEIGDIQFIYNNIVVFIIERKEIKDFVASIKDGRLRNQKYRLKEHSCPNNKIMYLIEQDAAMTKVNHFARNQYVFHAGAGAVDSDDDDTTTKSKPKQGVAYSTLKSAEINTIIRDGMQVYHTSSVKETAYILLKMWEKIWEHRASYALSTAILKNDGKSNTETLGICMFYGTVILHQRCK